MQKIFLTILTLLLVLGAIGQTVQTNMKDSTMFTPTQTGSPYTRVYVKGRLQSDTLTITPRDTTWTPLRAGTITVNPTITSILGWDGSKWNVLGGGSGGLSWQGSLDVSPDLTKDNTSNVHGYNFRMDSVSALNIFSGDVDFNNAAGRLSLNNGDFNIYEQEGTDVSNLAARMDIGAEGSFIRNNTQDGTIFSKTFWNADGTFEIQASSGAVYTASTHTFNGNTVFANNGTAGTGKVPTGTDGSGNWTWQTPSSGSVSSVGLTMPTGFSVSGSPITTSGTFGVTTSLNGILKGDGSGFGTVAVGGGLLYDGTTLSANPNLTDGLISGGIVTWLHDYVYNVSAATYVIGGIQYTSSSTDITLSAADPSLDRIDVFAVTTSSTAVAITGTPSSPPVEPATDASTQLLISFATVTANTTSPTIVNNWIYLENTEWTTSASAGTINPASTNNPYAGTKDIEGTNVANNTYITFTAPTTPNMGLYQNLIFEIRSKANWSSTKHFIIRFYNGTTAIGNPINFGQSSYGFVSTNTSTYQTVTIPLTDFGNISSATVLRITQSNSSGTIGWYLDNMQLQSSGGGGTPTTISLVTDVTGSGTNTISTTVTGIRNKSIPSLSTGILKYNGSAWVFDNTAYGTVTSVAMTGDNVIYNTSVTGSPITTSGTLVPTLKSQSQNLVLASPNGSSGTPTFRQVVNGDITNSTIDLTTKVTGVLPIANGGTNNGSLSVTNQNLLITDGSKVTALAKGSNGQHLIVNGSGNLAFVDTAVAGGSSYSFPAGYVVRGTGSNIYADSNLVFDTTRGYLGINIKTPTDVLDVYEQKPSPVGTVAIAAGTTVTGTNTIFTETMRPADSILINGETRLVTAIASNTSLTVGTAFSTTASGVVYQNKSLVGAKLFAVMPNGWWYVYGSRLMRLGGQSGGSLGFGISSFNSITTGYQNTAFGSETGTGITSGTSNTLLGYQAMNTGNGADNTVVGTIASAEAALSGNDNTIVGFRAGRVIGSGSNNVIIGRQAGVSVSNKNDNTIIGTDAGAGNSTRNSIIGRNAFGSGGGNDNTANGYYAGYMSLGTQNTYEGSQSGQYAYGADNQTAVGYLAVQSVNGVSSVTITNGGSGYGSPPTVTFSFGNVLATGTATVSGGAVTAVTVTNAGAYFGTPPTISFSGGGGSGAAATAVMTAGTHNTGFGYQAGKNTGWGSNNLYIGYDVEGVINSSNKFYLDNANNGTSSYLYGDMTSTSDRYLKVNAGFAFAYATKNVDYTLTNADHTIEVTATGKTMTIPSGTTTGQEFTIKLTASGSCTISAAANIDGSSTYSLSAQYKYVTITWNGSTWLIVANN